MNSSEETKGHKIYSEYKHFKRNSFKANINSINDLLLGKAQRIRNTKFIYVDENDGKNYISAKYFIIRRKTKNDKEDNKGNEIKIYYPHNFIYSIFFYDNKFFYINKKNSLLIFEIKENNATKYIFAQKEVKKDPKNNKKAANPKKVDEKKVINEIKEEEVNPAEDTNGKDISNKEFEYELIKKTNIIIEKYEEFKKKIELCKKEDSKLNERYELLIDILKNDLKEDLNSDNPKNINKIMKINFDDIINCEIKYYKHELDWTGVIQEKLNIQKGKVTFKDGISALITFIKNKRDKNIIYNKTINNIFKTPIIFKNFEDKFIPPKETIICEIKSSFYIKTLKSQIKEKINIVNDCLFDKGKPSYYIGIVNINDELVNELYKIKDVLDADFILEEKIIILATINYLYCDIDASFEVHTDYILYKKLNNMDKGIKGRFCIVFILFFILFILLFFLKNDINTMKNDIHSMKNNINKIDQRFNELYQILIDAKKNDNILLNDKKSFKSKDNNIPKDVCNPKEL